MKHTKQKKTEKKGSWVQNLFFSLAVILTLIYLGWRILFTLPFDDGIPQVIFGTLLISAEVITSFTTFELYYRKFKSDDFILPFPEVSESEYPHVDVFIATHNESLDILFKTANACTFMDYPDKDKVHIYFCDDGNRPTVAKLAEELGIGYLGLANNKHAKSGNYNNALYKTDSPLIATFDADMIPQHTFLMKTVPYFFLPTYIQDNDTGLWRKRTEEELKDAPRIGLIQTPQSFYNPDLFQFNLYCEGTVPNEQDFFSREVNIMRNSSNAIAYTGSNTVILRQAMVDIGGFPTQTITEDFEVSIRIQQEKYTTYATSEVQAAGLTTTDFKSMIKQRKRWARGIIQSLQNTRAILSPKLTLAGRVTYLCSYLYWLSFFNRLVFIMAPIMFALFDFRVVDGTFIELLLFWLPSYFFYSYSFRFLSSKVRSNRWSQIIDTIFGPYMIICVFLETLGIRETTFKVTSKERTERSDIVYAIPHMLLIVLSVLAIIRFTAGKYGWALFYSSIIIFWLCYNLIALTYAIFFMAGRKVYRRSERIQASVPIEVHWGNHVIPATTVDLSDEGMLFVRDIPCFLPAEQQFTIIIQSDRYRSNVSAKLAYAKQREGKWYYAVTLTPIDEENKRQYFQLVYDRPHSLPLETDPWSTVTDDIKRNILRRLHITPPKRETHPYIPINRTISFTDGTTAFAHDFNFLYFSLSDINDPVKTQHGIHPLHFQCGVVMTVRNTGRIATNTGGMLYEVVNREALSQHGVDFNALMQELLTEEVATP